jgi:hypothetical protein
MGFTVIHKGSTNGSQYAKYLDEVSRQLLQRGRSFDSVPRVRQNGVGNRWLYVSDSKDEAAAIADALKKQTRDVNWQVAPTTEEPSVGPLRPLDVRVTTEGDGWIFGMDPLTRRAIQLRFPGSCTHTSVVVGTAGTDEPLPVEDELRRLAAHALLMITGLGVDELQVFGGFRVVKSVTGEELVRPMPIAGPSV